MSRSLINVVNTNGGTALPVGSVYPLPQVTRKFGCDIVSNGVGVTCKNAGYYKITGTVTAVAGEAGVASVRVYVDGAPLVGAVSSLSSASGATITLPVNAVIRVNCCANPKEISLVTGGIALTSSNANLTVTKE